MKGQKTGGRQKGAPNRLPAALREEIMDAFFAEDIDKGILGGNDWLLLLKRDYVPVFAGLLSKILPKEIVAEVTQTTKTFTLNMSGLAHEKKRIASVLPQLARIGVDDTEIVEGQVTSVD